MFSGGSKGSIGKKRVKDTVEYLFNPLNHYDADLKEFFASVAYLGGNRSYNFIRGPMRYGQGKYLNKKNLSTTGECRMNLGAPLSKTLRKLQSAYTCESGVLKFLSLSH